MYRLISHLTTVLTTASFSLAPLLSFGGSPSESIGGLRVTLCSGGVIYMDLGERKDDRLPQAPHSKACHAVCCQRDQDKGEEAEAEPADSDAV